MYEGQALKFMKFDSAGLDLQVWKEKGMRGGGGEGVVVNFELIPSPLPAPQNSIFHQKAGFSCWVIFTYPTRNKVHKQHEMYMANANQNLAYPTQTIFHWLALGVLGFALGVPGFVDTNMLVLAMRNSCVGAIAQREVSMRRDWRCSVI